MEEQAKVKPFRTVIQLSDGARITLQFFAENHERAKERATHYANYESHVRHGSGSTATVLVVAEIVGTGTARVFMGGRNCCKTANIQRLSGGKTP